MAKPAWVRLSLSSLPVKTLIKVIKRRKYPTGKMNLKNFIVSPTQTVRVIKKCPALAIVRPC